MTSANLFRAYRSLSFGQRMDTRRQLGFTRSTLPGATDRLLTYARSKALSDAQLDAMKTEQSISGFASVELIPRVDRAVNAALAQLRAADVNTLLEGRHAGRKRLPSTTLGLITHAAEHACRHAGQIATPRRLVDGTARER